MNFHEAGFNSLLFLEKEFWLPALAVLGVEPDRRLLYPLVRPDPGPSGAGLYAGRAGGALLLGRLDFVCDGDRPGWADLGACPAQGAGFGGRLGEPWAGGVPLLVGLVAGDLDLDRLRHALQLGLDLLAELHRFIEVLLVGAARGYWRGCVGEAVFADE